MTQDDGVLTLPFAIRCGEGEHEVTLLLTAWGQVEVFNNPCTLLPEAVRLLAGSDCEGKLIRLCRKLKNQLVRQIQFCLCNEHHSGAFSNLLPEEAANKLDAFLEHLKSNMAEVAERVEKGSGAKEGLKSDGLAWARAILAGVLKDASAAAALIEQAKEHQQAPGVQAAAVWALAEIGNAEAALFLGHWLLSPEVVSPLKRKIISALPARKDEATLEFLLEALVDEDWSVRAESVKALGKIGDARAVETLVGMLKDEAKEVREEAVEALGKIGDSRAVQPLIRVFRDEEDDEVRKKAAKVLVSFKDERAVEMLVLALKWKECVVQAFAAWILGEIGDSRAVEPLIEALGDRDWLVQAAAADALGKIGDKRAVQPLIKTLLCRGWLVREVAAKALGMIGGDEAMEALKKAASTDKSKKVRDTAWEAIWQIKSQRRR